MQRSQAANILGAIATAIRRPLPHLQTLMNRQPGARAATLTATGGRARTTMCRGLGAV
jgi:hypothetical protein